MRSSNRNRRNSLRLTGIVCGLILAVWLVASVLYWPRHPWQYSRQAGADPYELRSYRALTAAQVRVTGRYPEALDEAIPLLNAYLDGDNLKQPVEITTIRGRTTEAAQKLRGAGPIFIEESGDLSEVSVVLPEGYSAEDAPRPRSPWVRIVTLPERTVTVSAMRGTPTASSFSSKRRSLESLMEGDNRAILSQFRVVQYGPWWAFPLVRRTEIHVTTR